jgi:hypothetical protein
MESRFAFNFISVIIPQVRPALPRRLSNARLSGWSNGFKTWGMAKGRIMKHSIAHFINGGSL